MAGFSVNIGADTKQLTTALVGAKQELNNFGKTAQGAGENISKVTPGANQASTALLNLGRVAQDAPFGFIGIANNIDPLIDSFRRLRVESGSNKAALQALGSSLLGGAGIGLAVSVVTSLLVVFGDKLFKASKETEELKKRQEDLQNAINGAFSATAKEATQVGTLVAVLRSETETRERRLGAIKELQQISPEIFKNLKLEGDAVVGLDNSYKAFLDNLKNVVAVRIQQARLEQLIEQQLKKQGTNLSGADRLGSIDAMREELQRLRDFQKQGGIVDPSQIKFLEDTIKRQESALSGLNKQINDIFASIQTLSKGVKINASDSSKEEDLLKKRLDALEKIKAATKDATTLVGLQEAIFELQVKIAIRDQGKNQLSKQELDQQITGFKSDLQKAFEAQALELEAIPKVKFTDVKTVEIPSDFDSKVAKSTGFDKKIPVITIQQARIKLLGIERGSLINATEEIINDLNKTIRQTISRGAVDAFSGIGEAFGEALTSGDFGSGLKKAAQGILGIMGGVLQEIGKQIIASALAIKALKATLEKFAITNPGLAVVAGIGLVALGSALKSIKFDGPKFAQGGIVTGPVIGQIGEMHRPEVIMPLDRLPQMLRSIGGGGDGGTEIIPFINNEGLYLMVQKGGRRTGRKF